MLLFNLSVIYQARAINAYLVYNTQMPSAISATAFVFYVKPHGKQCGYTTI
ncbi:hypothetical protein SAMN05428949_4546 [Chitinophaga sp. YR627]|nr:hypothetical protein SAMN05428949_4546 [Chitinophaga sp. YR627]